MKLKINHPEFKRYRSKGTSLIIVVVFLMVSVVSFAGPKKLKLSGEWKLDNESSSIAEYGEMMAATKLIFSQKGKNLAIERTGTSQTGENYTYTEKYTLDGEKCENIINETTIKKSTSAWSEDKKSLIITSTVMFEFNGEEMEIDLIETFELTEDMISLSLEQSATSDYGTIENTLIYNKE